MRIKLIQAIATCAVGAVATVHAGSYAGNPYSPTYGHAYRHGVVPTVETWKKMHDWAAFNPDFAATGPNTLSFGGGIDGIGVVEAAPLQARRGRHLEVRDDDLAHVRAERGRVSSICQERVGDARPGVVMDGTGQP